MKRFALILFVLLTLQGFAQEMDPQKQAVIEQRIELISEAIGDEEADFNTLFDDLSYYYDHPINLNNTTRDELQELMMLSEIQITALLEHIERNGKLISIYELQAVPGFDLATINNILPFVMVRDNFNAPHANFNTLMKDGTHEVFLRWSKTLEATEGFLPTTDSALAESPNSRYLGSADRLYFRYRYRFGNSISFGITGEKDAGEQFFQGAQKNGFDFYSAHLLVRNIGMIKTAVVGDYQVSFGQGLTFATGIAMGKTSNSLNIKRTANVLRPYTSVDENQFMRGAAITFGVKKFEITALFSYNKVDANQVGSADTNATDEELFVVSSLQTSGLHSTPSEIEDKDAATVMHYGGHAAWKTKRSNFGATAVYTGVSPGLEKSITPANQFDFQGDHNVVTGIDFNHIWRNLNFFGEVSRSQNGGMAMQSGILASLDPRFSLTVVYRNYAKNYQALFANALAEGSRPVNEKGLYIGAEARFNAQWTLNAYFDSFESTWLKSTINGPMRGMEYLMQLNWRPNKKMDMYFRFRHRNKAENSPDDVDDIEVLLDKAQNNYRFQYGHKLSDALSIRTRLEYTEVFFTGREKEQGFLMYQDIVWKPKEYPVSLTFRYALFDTDSYDSRLYAFENDVLYYYAIPSFYDRGTRVYGIFRYQFKKNFDLWVKYSQSLYNNRTTINSGLNEIQGNKKSELRIQLRLRF